MNSLQQTIQGLLGVHVDAFEGEARGERVAEMDVDRFLVEANGSGIREALRIILDLELKEPELALIEEPEVHLHPGLARVLATYLRERSADIQMFVTTHSTEFVDSVSFQNAYLVSRGPSSSTAVALVTASDATSAIPEELGLRLSTVFMFDRLLFVEGPSDEAVLRVFCTKMQCELGMANVGFVHLKGVQNFGHFAAESTIDLLSRRRVLMWFLIDRDERDDNDLHTLTKRLGDRARLLPLQRRELENYLLAPNAITALINEKLQSTLKKSKIEVANVQKAITEEVELLKPEVIRLRINRRTLAPLILGRRDKDERPSSAAESIKRGIETLGERPQTVTKITSEVENSVNSDWSANAEKLVPGALLLDRVFGRFSLRFHKEKDSERLAVLMSRDEVHRDIVKLLEEVTK